MAKKRSSAGELLHFGFTRLRVTGSGTLRQTLYSLDDVRSSVLPTLTMSATTNREPLTLCNFIEQRAALEIKTTAIDETFRIDKIIIFVRVVATGYPQ